MYHLLFATVWNYLRLLLLRPIANHSALSLLCCCLILGWPPHFSPSRLIPSIQHSDYHHPTISFPSRQHFYHSNAAIVCSSSPFLLVSCVSVNELITSVVLGLTNKVQAKFAHRGQGSLTSNHSDDAIKCLKSAFRPPMQPKLWRGIDSSNLRLLCHLR
jgi:hypothetical protein